MASKWRQNEIEMALRSEDNSLCELNNFYLKTGVCMH